MEKVSFRNSRNLNLIGEYYPSISDAGIIFAHGFTGDKSEKGRFDQAAEVLNQEGYNVLRFDFSGSGESDDDSLTVDKQIDDLEHAIKFVQQHKVERIGILGLSLGALVAAKVYDPKIGSMVFWAPVTHKIRYSWDKRYSSSQLRELEENGYLTVNKDKGVRRTYIVDKQMLIDRSTVDQAPLLSRIKIPVLIIHGTADNRVPFEDSVSAMKYLPIGSKLEAVAGADHSFIPYLGHFIEESVKWFKEKMPP